MGFGRSDVNRQYQLGVEVTPGVSVAANKLLNSLSFDLSPEKIMKKYRAQGSKFNTKNRLHRIWMQGTYSGALSYRECVYPLSSLMAALITTPAGATLARQWLFKPKTRDAETMKSFTIQEGDEAAGEAFPHVMARSLELAFEEEDVNMSGGLIGQMGTVGALTANPTAIDPDMQIVGANELSVYMATSGDLANLFTNGNKITDPINESFNLGEKIDPKFVHNSSFKSFKDIIEKPPELSFGFDVEFNAQARTLYEAAKSQTFRYMGIRAVGEEIETGQNFLFEVTIAGDVTPQERKDPGGVWGYGFGVDPKNDSALGAPFQIRVINDLTGL